MKKTVFFWKHLAKRLVFHQNVLFFFNETVLFFWKHLAKRRLVFHENILLNVFFSSKWLAFLWYRLVFNENVLLNVCAAVCFLFFETCILDPSMDTDKNIPKKHTRKMKNLLNMTLFISFRLYNVFSKIVASYQPFYILYMFYA